jgi:phosphoacetylglucosamine mutase
LATQGICSAAVIQTAYANGASAAYLKQELGMVVAIAKTGVKHLHATALQYDVGVYFEANGHGSVTFSDKCLMLVAQRFQAADGRAKKAAQELQATIQVSSQ